MSALLIDLGGTNIRFSLGNTPVIGFKCREYTSFFEAVEHYLSDTGEPLPETLVMDIPGPVHVKQFRFDNNPWTFTIDEIKNRLGFKNIFIVNDFEAAALAVPHLKERDIYTAHQTTADTNSPIVVMGAGTGLGQALLVPEGTDWKVLGAEGGHSTLPATNQQERELISYAEKKFGHVSAERFVSGQGLSFTYEALSAIQGIKNDSKKPEEITILAKNGDKFALETYHQMFSFWGSVAGNVALSCGAFGGVYLTGGMIRQDGVLDIFKTSPFVRSFQNKGRRFEYMHKIPIHVFTAHDTAFLGLKHILEKYIDRIL